MNKIFTFFKKNTVFAIALCAALITCFFVPPDREYLNYFDMKTLTCLFCTLAVVNGLKNIKFFDILAGKIVSIFKNTRSSIIALVYITFIGSMLIANDMALITFLPLGYFALVSTNKEKYMAFPCWYIKIAIHKKVLRVTEWCQHTTKIRRYVLHNKGECHIFFLVC